MSVRVPGVLATIDVVMTPLAGWDLVARAGAPCPGSTCNDSASVGGAETLRFTVAGPGVFYLLVDGFNASDAGAFTVGIRLN